MVGKVVPAVVAVTSHVKELLDIVWFQSSRVWIALCGVWQYVHSPTAGVPTKVPVVKSWPVLARPVPGSPGAAHDSAGESANAASVSFNLVRFMRFPLKRHRYRYVSGFFTATAVPGLAPTAG